MMPWRLAACLLLGTIGVVPTATPDGSPTQAQRRVFETIRGKVPAAQRTALKYALYQGAFIVYLGEPAAQFYHVIGSCHLSYAPVVTPPLRIEPTGCAYTRLDLYAMGVYDRENVPRPWDLGLAPDPLPFPKAATSAAADESLSAAQRSAIEAVKPKLTPGDRSRLYYVVYRSTLLLLSGDVPAHTDWAACNLSLYVMGSANVLFCPCKNGGPGFERGTHMAAIVAGAPLTSLDSAVQAVYSKFGLPAVWTRPWGYFF